MQKIKWIPKALFSAASFWLLSTANAQTIPEEARRHMIRGQAAVEMAKSPDDYDSAIAEFQKAIELAPEWPNPYYNLGLAQEMSGKYKEAVASLEQYLILAPNASDEAIVQERIYKLEYKAEQILTTPEIIEVLGSFAGWETDRLQGCNKSRKELSIKRQGAGVVYVPTYNVPGGGNAGEYVIAGGKNIEVTGPALKYTTAFNICNTSVFDNNHEQWPDFCFYKIENEIKVVSKTLVKVTQNKIGNGSGVTKCTFQKK
jgi:tetratricopeptide (TPR) repeat protein